MEETMMVDLNATLERLAAAAEALERLALSRGPFGSFGCAWGVDWLRKIDDPINNVFVTLMVLPPTGRAISMQKLNAPR